MATLATLVVKLVGDAGQFSGEMDRAASRTSKFLDGLKKNTQAIGKLALGAGAAMAGAIGGALVKLGPQAINAASDFDEAFSKTSVVFGDSATAVVDFSKTAAAALGIPQREALATAATYGNLFTTMGLAQPAAADMSQNLVTLASDLASFNNIETAEVLDKLRAGLVGETEPLRALGINLTAAAVDAQALDMGLADANGTISEAAKLQARFAMITEQSANAQGDFARTSDGLANTQKILGAVWQDTLQTAGTVFLPLVTSAFQGLSTVLSGTILPGIEMVANAFSIFQAGLSAGVPPLVALQVALASFLPMDLVSTIIGGIETIIGGIQRIITAVAPYVQAAVEWIGNTVQIKDILIALGIAVASVVVPALLAILAPIASIIATGALLIAAVTAIRTAWETDFMGIRTAIEAWWASMQPVFQQVISWFQNNIPVAIAAVTEVWNSVLLPALQAGYAVFQNQILPVLQAIDNVLQAALVLALKATAKIFNEVLVPAIKMAAGWLADKLQPALSDLAPFLEKVKGGFDGIAGAIQAVADWISRLTDKLDNVTLPDWMTPGSPTPLEIGLLGIQKALQKVNEQGLSGLQSRLGAMPTTSPAGGMTAAMGTAVGGAAGGAGQVNFYIDGSQDPETVAQTVMRRLREIGVAPGAMLR